MKKALHILIVLAGVVPWLLAMLGMSGAMVCALLADRLLPEETAGNCWSFTLPRWWRSGGYIAVRLSDPPFWFVPHAILVAELPESTQLAQTLPKRRAKRWWQAWKTLYFDYRVVRKERRR